MPLDVNTADKLNVLTCLCQNKVTAVTVSGFYMKFE